METLFLLAVATVVIVLVFEAIRKWVFASGGLCTPISVVPEETVKSPCGVLSTRTAPGINCSLMVVSTRSCKAAWSMGLSPDVAPAGELSVLDGSMLDGGVLDRIDSLLPVLPFTLAAVLWL